MDTRTTLMAAMMALGASVLLAGAPSPLTTAPGDGQTVTAKGCLRAEADVPGRAPNVAERAGLGEDFILTDAKLTTPTGVPKAPEGSTKSALWKSAFKIEGLDDDELRKHLGHQVQVTGRLQMPTTMAGAPEDRTVEHLREIHATSITMVATRCAGSS